MSKAIALLGDGLNYMATPAVVLEPQSAASIPATCGGIDAKTSLRVAVQTTVEAATMLVAVDGRASW